MDLSEEWLAAAGVKYNPYRPVERGEPGTIGWQVHYFDELASTQIYAAELARNGCAQGTVVIAEAQHAGRGRMGRRWHSPPHVNLYTTIILRPTMEVHRVARLSLVAGVAAAEVVEGMAPGIVGLKWPNDVWFKGKKAGGIIAEAISSAGGKLECVLLGIGLNLNLAAHQVPSELRDSATSLFIETGRTANRVEVASRLFTRLNSRYMESQTSSFEAILSAWKYYSVLDGKRVVVKNGNTRTAGEVAGIDTEGALVLRAGSKLTRILAGDVSIEEVND